MTNLETPNSEIFQSHKFLAEEKKELRRCKIVGTLGPASSNEATLRELILSGLNVARLNFSHGTHDDHLKNIEMVRRLSRELGRPVSILQDLQGPKIRCGQVLNGQINIEVGQKYILTYGKEQTEEKIIPIDYPSLIHDVSVGQDVLMDDGLLAFKITAINNEEVEVECTVGGTLKPRKGVNFPDSTLSLPAMTEKDSQDLIFGIANRVDFVALSFVQKPDDVIKIKNMITALGADTPVISKIEKIPAVESIDEIAKLSDGLMVARGDLGVEARVERVPGFQKRIISAARKHAKPVIIATQMLDSMINNPRPTISESTDVANGVLDGADALMLSGEVASGKYPVKCVQKMDEIIRDVEFYSIKDHKKIEIRSTEDLESLRNLPTNEAIARAACEAAKGIDAKAIVCLTLTGSIARSMAKWRPETPIVAITPRTDIVKRLALNWGVYALPNSMFINTDNLLQELPHLLKYLDFLKSGDSVIITAGIPINKMLPTNMIKINKIP